VEAISLQLSSIGNIGSVVVLMPAAAAVGY